MKTVRVWTALLVAVVMMVVAVGCGETSIDEPKGENKKEPTVVWDGDLKEHWTVGADGAAVDKAAHTLDEGGTCTVCGAYVVDFGDGSGAITVVNEYGDTTIYRSYNTDGTVEWESKSDITYDEQGRRASEVVYNDGVLQQETTYQHGKNGDELFSLKEIYYNEDGTKEESDYNEVGDVVKTVYYDADGKAVSTETFEYELTKDDQVKGRKVYTDGTLTLEEVYTPDADGWYYISEEITYNPDGSVDSVTKYDSEGNTIE